jgi:hypothetical protein
MSAMNAKRKARNVPNDKENRGGRRKVRGTSKELWNSMDTGRIKREVENPE